MNPTHHKPKPDTATTVACLVITDPQYHGFTDFPTALFRRATLAPVVILNGRLIKNRAGVVHPEP